MGNTRGNIYSRNHVELDPDQDPEFWQYSWVIQQFLHFPFKNNTALNNMIVLLISGVVLLFIQMGRDRLLRYSGLHPLRPGCYRLGQVGVRWTFAGNGPFLHRHDSAPRTQFESAPHVGVGAHFQQTQLAQPIPARFSNHRSISGKLLESEFITLKLQNPWRNPAGNFMWWISWIDAAQVVMDKMPKKAIFDQDMTLRTFQKRLCERNFFKASFCRDILFLIAGANPDNFDLVSMIYSTETSPFSKINQ